MAPFPLCCVAGLATAESVATLAAAAAGLASGADLALVATEFPDFKGESNGGVSGIEQIAVLTAVNCTVPTHKRHPGCRLGPRLSLLPCTPSLQPDANAPLPALVTEHKKLAKRIAKVQAPLVLLGTAGAAAAAVANRDKAAAGPLAVAALVNTAVIALSLTLIKKAEKDIVVRSCLVVG